MRSENNGVPNVSCFRDVGLSHLLALVYPRESHQFGLRSGQALFALGSDRLSQIAREMEHGAPFTLNPQLRPAPAEAGIPEIRLYAAINGRSST